MPKDQGFKIFCKDCGHKDCEVDVRYDTITTYEQDQLTLLDKVLIYCPICLQEEAFF